MAVVAIAALGAVNVATRDSSTPPPAPAATTPAPPVAADPVVVRVGGVITTADAVDFEVAVHNATGRPLGIERVVSPGLAVALRERAPVVVAPNAGEVLHVRATLPDCNGLTPEAEPGVPFFGSLAVVFQEVADRPLPAVAVPLAETARVYPALVELRLRTCPPGSYRRHPPG